MKKAVWRFTILAAVCGPLVGCGEGTAASGGSAVGGQSAGRSVADTTLMRLLAELQPQVERSSGLMALSPARMSLNGREELQEYLTAQLEEQLPRDKAESMTAAYARFGLVPDTLDLTALLVDLYEEQIAGYYDPRRDTLYVMDHVGSEQLEIVLSHELVHALQDQYVDLDSLTTALAADNDRATAAQAAIEGQATLAMFEWQMGRMQGAKVDVTELPDLGEMFAGVDIAAVGASAGMPAIGNAPRVIQEALIFPYVGGMSFVQRLWKAESGRPPPFGANLPTSTEQVLHWDRFAGPRRDEPTTLRFTGDPGAGWTQVHADGLGELETRIFFEEHLADASAAAAAAAGWDGDRYRLLRGDEGEALIWATVWDGPSDAQEFADAVRGAFDARYGGAPERAGRRVRVERTRLDGRPAVLVLDLPSTLPDDRLQGLTDVSTAER